MAVSLPNLFEALEVVPGGRFNGDPGMENLLATLTTILGDIINQGNTSETTINSLTAGLGGLGVRPMVIGYTTPGRNNAAIASLTRGGEVLQLHSSGDLIVAWKEWTGAGNLWEIFLKKSTAASNYLVWTNLAGDSQEPTSIAPAFAQLSLYGVLFCENTKSGDLNVFVYDNTAATIKQYVYTFDGTNFALSLSNQTVSSGCFLTLGDVLCTRDYLVLLERENNIPATVVIASVDSPTSWAEVVSYNAVTYSGANYAMTSGSDQKRLIDFGDGRVLALFEVLSGTDYNIGWAMSDDYGATWPVGDTGSGTEEEINYPGEKSGLLFPQTSGGAWSSANLIPAGFGGLTYAEWNAARIAGTNRVGLVFLAKPDPSGGAQASGVLYAEFDADALTWTAQADMVRLAPANVGSVGVTSGPLYFNDGVTAAQGVGGKCVCASDGVVRCFWMHGHDVSASTADRIVGIHYRRLNTGADAEDTTEWRAQREAIPLHAEVSSASYYVSEFVGCKQGLVTINEVAYFPVIWWHHTLGATTKTMTYAELRFALLPVALLDLP